MAGADQPNVSRKLRRLWQNLWGQDPDLRLETRWQRFMAFWGLHVPPPGRQDRLHIRPRFFKVIFVLAVAIPLFLVGAAFKISTSPLLCNQCHIMKPYYQAWKTSKHNFVPCVDCHYPPGFRDIRVFQHVGLRWKGTSAVMDRQARRKRNFLPDFGGYS